MEWNPKETKIIFLFSWSSGPLELFPVLVWTVVQLPHPLSDPNILSELFFFFPWIFYHPVWWTTCFASRWGNNRLRHPSAAGGRFSGSPYGWPHIAVWMSLSKTLMHLCFQTNGAPRRKCLKGMLSLLDSFVHFFLNSSLWIRLSVWHKEFKDK